MTMERHGRVGMKHHIGAAPGIVVDQPPGMAAARGILSEQNVPGGEDEKLAVPGLEFQRPAQGDDQLADRRRVPVQCAAGGGFLKRHRRDGQLAAQDISMDARVQIDRTDLEMGGPIIFRPNTHTTNHGPDSLCLSFPRTGENRSTMGR